MSNQPDDVPDDLPEEVARLLQTFGGAGMVEQMRNLLTQPQGPVNWDLARRVAFQIASPEDRGPTAEEEARLRDGQDLAEHWLDEGTLPAPPDAGRLAVISRSQWVEAALAGLRTLVEPVATASTGALADLVQEQVGQVDGELTDLLGGMQDPAAMIRPLGAVLTGLQAGQVIGQLSQQLLGQYELGIPTAERATAYHLAINVAETFDGWELDATEVAVVLALHEGAYRRVYHAVPWLQGHVELLVSRFAAGVEVDADRLMRMAQEFMVGVDPDDPESMQQALQRAAQFRLEPTAAQLRVLERLQGVVCLVQAWVRREIQRIASGRLPNLARIDEVLRRRRASTGDGERLLAQLLGLDLKPDDETLGDRFVETVERARGPEGLRRALAHPENLPGTGELADPARWLTRMAAGEEVPDDPSALFADGAGGDGLRSAEGDGPGDSDDPGDDSHPRGTGADALGSAGDAPDSDAPDGDAPDSEAPDSGDQDGGAEPGGAR